MKTASFALVRKRKTLQVIDQNEVRCPRKSPVGDVISVVKCADIFDVSAEGCGPCRQYLDAKPRAVKLRSITSGEFTREPRPSQSFSITR